MSRKRTTRGGFTLIELIITVAIVGVLSSTAIGLFKIQQLRAKRTEAMTNLEAIAKMERSFFGESGIYPGALPIPLGLPGQKQNWDTTIPDAAGFNQLGFQSEGTVWYVYDVNSTTNPGLCAPGDCPSGACFTASAYGDSDLDGGTAVIGYFHADDLGAVCPTLVIAAIGPPIDPADGMPILEQPVDINQWSGPLADDY
jgi:prepilin-type N-terminal cleavage/methylation domain-containing protein